MKDFNDFEQKLIRILVDDYSDNEDKNVHLLFREIATEYEIDINFRYELSTISFLANFGNIKASMRIDGVPFGIQNQQVNEIRNKSVLILSLFDYLEKQHLIYLYKERTPHWNTFVINGKKNRTVQDTEDVYFGDVLANTILEKSQYSLFATPELYGFVKHDFQTAEQRRHNENMAFQKLSVSLAILFGVSGLLIAVVAIIVSLFSLR